MISPHKSPPKNSGTGSPRTAARLRGLFVDGIWRCNCPGRPPAIQFQVKNQGVNHGRWFYTCQQPKEKQCDFFLWASDAETRAKLVVLASSSSELDAAAAAQSRTPAKPAKYQNGLPTPATERRTGDTAAKTSGGKMASFQTQLPYKNAKARKMMAEDSPDTEPFDWDEDLDEQLASSFGDGPSPSPPAPAPPRQPDFGQPRTPTRSSPGKRKLSVFEEDGGSSGTVRGDSGGGVFTPLSSQEQWFPPLSAEVSMTPTPSRYTNALSADSGSPGDISEFAGQALKLLEGNGVIVSRRAQNDLVSLLNTHDLNKKAIIRGRDITREALKKRDEQIMRLNERIQSLESQRELDHAMVNGLKNNLA